MSNRLGFLFTAISIFLSSTSWAKNSCYSYFHSSETYQDLIANRKIPAIETVMTEYNKMQKPKNIVAVLLNQKSYQEAQDLLQNSIGLVTAHQPMRENDHGLIRIGEYFIDRDLPGMRARGEMNSNGISWINVGHFLDRVAMRTSMTPQIEVLFRLSPEEMKIAKTYHLARRASLYDVDFTIRGEVVQSNQVTKYKIKLGQETCYKYSCASETGTHLLELAKEIGKSVVEINKLLSDSSVNDYLNSVQRELLNQDIKSIKLNPYFVFDGTGFVGIKNPKDLTTNQLTGLFVYRTLKQYHQLMQSLEINFSRNLSHVDSPRASAVVIYDTGAREEYFLSNSYTSIGAYSSWLQPSVIMLQSANAN